MSDGGADAYRAAAYNFLASIEDNSAKTAMEKSGLKVAEPLGFQHDSSGKSSAAAVSAVPAQEPGQTSQTNRVGASVTLLKAVALEENPQTQLPLQEILSCDGDSLYYWLSHTQWEWCDLLTLVVPVSVSTVFHVTMLITFQMWAMPEIAQSPMPDLVVETQEEIEEEQELLKELETVELDEQIEAATEIEFIAGGDTSLAGSSSPTVSNPQLNDSILEQDAEQQKMMESLSYMPGRENLLSGLPEGTLGKARAVVNDYNEAIDRITQEIISMLSESKVLVVWCFDQSESMKDDQQKISERIERVYTELGLSDAAMGDALTTAVTSYGRGFMVHTKLPTSDIAMIREAIKSVPIDPSGKEIMCQAVACSIAMHRKYIDKTSRRMALILVTDESGNRSDNLQYLEQTIAEAKDSRCRVYILGRESVFGYPYAHIRWQHPQTEWPHWIQIDRGPETAFIEQIQTDGFRRRHDAFPSGYGPYEQSRLAHQTGGIFFLLPSKETNIIRGEKRRYALKAIRSYQPDLRSRLEILYDRDTSPLRTMIWGIVNDLNPYNKDSAEVIEMRIHFSTKPDEFVRQVKEEHTKAKTYLMYLDAAAKMLEENRQLRDEEPSLRWKANYDLLYAQLLAYKVRIYEYGACLEEFVKEPKVVPKTKSPDLYLTHWTIATRQNTLTGELTASTIKRADDLFAEVVKQHPGTPWASRANWERRRGFGVELRADYCYRYKKVADPIPVPKL